MTRRTYWLSFADSRRPPGEQFLGVIVVDVTDTEAAQTLALQPGKEFTVEGAWLSAAIRATWRAQVNLGGEVLSGRIDGRPEAALFPRLTLLSRAQIDAIDNHVPLPS